MKAIISAISVTNIEIHIAIEEKEFKKIVNCSKLNITSSIYYNIIPL